MLMTPVWMAALATLGGGLTPDSYATVYGTYSAGLAAVADGATFAAPLDTYRNGVYRRANSGAADMIGAQPVSVGLELLRPTVAAVSMPGAPLLDITAADGLWNVYGLPNRAGGSAQNANLLWNCQGTDRFAVNGGATRTAQQTDSVGGKSAIRLNIPASSAADSRLLRTITVPPGRWTFAAVVRSINGATGNIQLSFDGGTTRNGLAVTPARQLVYQTFHQTSATSRTLSVFHGDYPSACATSVDVEIECLWLGPGTAIDAPAAPAAGVQVGFAVRGTPDYSPGRVWQLGSASTLEAVGIPASLPAWTLLVTGDITRGSGVQALAVPGGTSGNAGAMGTNTATVAGQQVHGLVWNNYNGGSAAMKMLRHGPVSLAVVYTGAEVRTYVNGVLVETVAQTAAMATAVGRIGLFGSVSSAGTVTFASTGQACGSTLWGRALSASEVAAAHTAAATRAAAHALTLRTMTRAVLVEGDSISAGSGDTSPANGYASRAYELLTAPLPIYENRAVISAGLEGNAGNSLLSRQAGLVTRIGELVAVGITPVVTVMIGANDSGRLNTPGGVDTYVTTLRGYVAALKAAGARVVVGTPLPAQGAGIVAGYDSGTMTISGGPLSGQTFDGGRRYYAALLRYHAAGDGYYLADSDAVANWATSTAAQAAGFYTNPDYVHPNAAGHADLGANVWLSPLSTALS